MSRHYYYGLPDEKEKDTFQKCHCQYQQTIEQNAERENIVHTVLKGRSAEQRVNIQSFAYKVERVTHQLSRYDPKKV